MNLALAVIGAVAVVLGFVTAVFGYLSQRRSIRALELGEATAQKVQTISVRVNGHLSALLAELLDERAELERIHLGQAAAAAADMKAGPPPDDSHGGGPESPDGACNTDSRGPDESNPTEDQ